LESDIFGPFSSLATVAPSFGRGRGFASNMVITNYGDKCIFRKLP
jgi:hypothetical protein